MHSEWVPGEHDSYLLVPSQRPGRLSCSPAARARLLPFEAEIRGLGLRTISLELDVRIQRAPVGAAPAPVCAGESD